MTNLASTDWLILLLYLFLAVAIGLSLRSNIKTSNDFLQAGRSLPTWICALAFLAAGLGSQEMIAMGAAGARYGFRAALFFSLGAIPAMLFAGVFMMPLYYGSGARSVPEYLGLRFDQKTRLLNAITFAITTLAGAGVSLYLMGRLFQTLHIFDPLFYAYGWPRQAIFTFSVLLPAAIVLVYVLLAGLAGAMINQALQFAVVVAGFLPVVLMGLKQIGGWSGLKTSFSGAVLQQPTGMAQSGALAIAAIGFVLTAGHWTTDFRILQTALAAKNIESARRIPLFAAVARLFIPFLLILPGAIAIGLPTPHSTTVVRNENGAIYHEITVVPPEAAAGQGLVPACVDTATGNPQLDAAGHPQLDYIRSTPNMLLHFLPIGLLGLGVAALLASLMSGLAAAIAAFNTVFTYDIYQPCMRNAAADKHFLAVARWAALGGILVSVGAAYAVSAFGNAGAHCSVLSNILYLLLLTFSLVNAPQLATFLLGMFTRRTTGHGAFAGFAAGIATALLHYGLTLPADANPGIHGGWIAMLHRYPSFIAQCFWTAIFAFVINMIVAMAVSLSTRPRPEPELKGLVHSLTPSPATATWWKRPESMAVVILLAATALAIFFA